jgi:hypothetical protein
MVIGDILDGVMRIAPLASYDFENLSHFIIRLFYLVALFLILYNKQMDDELGIKKKQHPVFDNVIDQI